MAVPLHISSTLTIPDTDITERFVRASGPGGQNVNKVATAVELRFDVAASSLPQEIKDRLIALAGRRMTSDGALVIDSREYRTQAQNREAARARLVALVQHAARRPKTRRPTKPGKGAKERRLESKHHRTVVKRTRSRENGDE
jgi:ribosome-associated protein